MSRHRLLDHRGQSTVEYVALMALLAVLVVGAGAAAMAPTYVNATMGGFQRALCIVTGRECRSLDEQACVVRGSSDGHKLSANILFVRLEDGRVLLQERLSDGSIRITVTDTSGAGGEIGIGAGAGINVSGLKLDASAQANASLLGLFGRGKVYLARDAGEAQGLVRRIEDGKAGDPDISFHEGGLRADAAAKASAGASLGVKKDKDDDPDAESEKEGKELKTSALAEVSAGVKASLARAVGHRKDHRSGETTWYLRADNAVSASAGASFIGAGKAGVEAPAYANGLLSVTTDRHGRVVALGALATYAAGAGYSVSHGPSDEAGGRRHELEVTADPDDPTILAALRDLGDHPGASAVKALTQAMYDRGRIDRRAYEVDEDADSVSGSLALGAKVGAGYERSSEQARLVEASTRPPGGVWEQRFDCLDRA